MLGRTPIMLRMDIDWQWIIIDSWVTGKLYNRSVIYNINLISVSCSHIRAVELYIDSIYNRRSLVGVSCSSWDDIKDDKCKTNPTAFMGHDTEPR